MSVCTPEDRPLSETSQPGEGMQASRRENPMHRLPHWSMTLPLAQSSPRCGAKTRSGNPCRSPAMPNGRCRMHGGLSPGAPKGNQNALKHGRYTAVAVANRREIAALLRSMKGLAKEVD